VGILGELDVLEAADPTAAASPNDRSSGGGTRTFSARPGLPTLLGVGIAIGTNVETRIEIMNNVGQTWTVVLPPAPAPFIGARGLVIAAPEHEPRFDTSLLRGLQQLNMDETGDELHDRDTHLLASVLGTAPTDDALSAIRDQELFSILLERLADAEPAGLGSAAVALGLGAKIGTPEGLASLLRHASRLLGVGIPPAANSRAFKGTVRMFVSLLGRLAAPRSGIARSDSLVGQPNVVDTIMGIQSASQGPTVSQVANAKKALRAAAGDGPPTPFEASHFRVAAQDGSVQDILCDIVGRGSLGQTDITKASIIAAAKLAAGRFHSLADAATLLTEAAGQPGELTAAKAAAGAGTLDAVVEAFRCPWLSGSRNGAAVLLVQVSGLLPRAPPDITAMMYVEALTRLLHDHRSSPAAALDYKGGTLIAPGGRVRSAISSYVTHGLVPTAIKEAIEAMGTPGKRKGAPEGGGDADAGARAAGARTAGDGKKSATPCLDFVRGSCKFGAACKFKHDLNAVCPKGAACTFLAGGSCVFRKH